MAEHLLQEKLYEVHSPSSCPASPLQVLDEVQCPQLVLTAGEDRSAMAGESVNYRFLSENEKPGGLADRVWG